MAYLNYPAPRLKVLYDCRGKRASKSFDDPYLARRFTS